MYKPRDFNMRSFAITSSLPRQHESVEVRGEIYGIGDLNRAIENTGIKLLEEEIQKAQILSNGIIKNTIKINGGKSNDTFSIEYNPYMVSCLFKKNDKVLTANSKIGAKSNERLQILLGESVNWKGLPAEIASACDDDEVTIHFKGRRIDFDDLQYTIDLYDGPVSFQLVFEESKNDADVISELDGIFDDIRQKNIPEFNAKNEEGKDIYTAYEEVKNGIFEVSVIATMSSGKSTLINSLLHTELLPSENKACTATICRILDNDDMDTYEAECYGSDNSTVIYPRQEITVEG